MLRDPRNFEPIYVGKGCNGRMFKHWENMLCGKPGGALKLYRKLTSIFRAGYSAPIYEKLLECADEKACFLVERFFIKSIGRENLCNYTDGGEGASGFVWSEESRRKQSTAAFLRTHSDASRAKMRESWRPREETADVRYQKGSSNRGKKFTEEHCRKISESNMGRAPLRPEVLKRIADKKTWNSPYS